ncbi:MAG: hypothetical protein OXF57_13110, partial [Rhodospirillaceae bacterium]|nr:hypothetical protein [Rhodospirillaceae bacterium]
MAVIKGTDGDDTLTGGAGTDMLLGGDGDDTLVSNGGVDILYGGEGADRFVVGDAAGYTWIGDFEAGTDTIDLSGLQRDLTWEDVSANMTSRVSFWGTYVEIDLTEWGGGTVAVYGVTSPDQLTADSFTLPARDAPINEIGGDGDDTIIGDM